MSAEVVGGAASGAAMGAKFGGPWGAVVGGVIGGAMGLFKGKARKAAEKARKRAAKYNAAVVRMNAKANSDAIQFKTSRLGKQQREVKGQGRMSVGSRGGLMGGTDLIGMIDNAETMQVDLIEGVRQADIEIATGENKANMIMYEAEMQVQASKDQARSAAMGQVMGAAVSFGKMKMKSNALAAKARDAARKDSLSILGGMNTGRGSAPSGSKTTAEVMDLLGRQ